MTDSTLLSRKQCREYFQAASEAARRAGVHEVEVTLAAGDEPLTRFANNEIHQNMADRSRMLSVRTIIDGRTARASTNRLNRDGIQAVVDEAIALTRASEPDPAILPLYEGDESVHCDRFSPEVAACTPQERAVGVADGIRAVETHGQTAAGIYATEQSVHAILNSTGLFRYHCETKAQFSITAMAADSSGWAKASSPIHEAVHPRHLAETAARKAALSANPREIPPGAYTVVLEPAAVLDLVGQIFGDFSATAVRDQRSFLNGRLGQKIFGSNINMYDDVNHPLQAGPPFDGEGVMRKALTLVESGVVKEIADSRTTGHGFPLPNDTGEAPVNLIIRGGNTTVEQMIASTGRGILVTRFWYIREVEPYDKVMTGMTRDGTFLIEDGMIVCGLRNFRFNQSVVELLNNVESLSASVRSTGEEAIDMVVPAMKAHGFEFTEVTRF
jgi:PmbA protein